MTNLIPKTVQLQINYLTHLHNLGSSYLIILSDIIGFLQISGGTEYKPLYEFSKNKELPTTRRVKGSFNLSLGLIQGQESIHAAVPLFTNMEL